MGIEAVRDDQPDARPNPVRRFGSPVVPYERRLDADPEWALSEGSRFFEGKGGVHAALRKIVNHLEKIGVPYAVSGGLALFFHGHRRFTEDVDLLVTRADREKIHAHLRGRGYLPPFETSKNLRDTELGVKVEFLATGDYPGDGRPKPVAFPDPRDVAVEIDGLRVLSLETLIDLKLASGLTNPDRAKDLVDVQELIRALALPEGTAERLAPYVREKYRELWRIVFGRPRLYGLSWPNPRLAADAGSIDEAIAGVEERLRLLREMRSDGVRIDAGAGTAGEVIQLVTDDPAVARKYGMEPLLDWTDEAGETA